MWQEDEEEWGLRLVVSKVEEMENMEVVLDDLDLVLSQLVDDLVEPVGWEVCQQRSCHHQESRIENRELGWEV